MKTRFQSLLITLVCCMLGAFASAAELTVILDSGTPTPPEGTVTFKGAKYDSGSGAVKLGSTGNYVEWVLESSTFTAASFEGYINTVSVNGNNWAFQFTTDGTNWSEEVTQANDGNKTKHKIDVEAEIPAGAKGIRIIRRAGTSTILFSITLTTGGSVVPVEPADDDATLKSLSFLDTPLKGFQPNKYEYDLQITPVELATFIATQNVKYETTNPDAKVTYDSEVIEENVSYKITITVTAADGVTTQDYIINVLVTDEPIVEPSSDATLSAIKVDDQLVSGFAPDKLSYSVVVEADAKGEVSYTVSDANAIASAKTEKVSETVNKVTITVIAEDETMLIYTVTVTHKEKGSDEPVVVPGTKLTIHRPEKYETMTTFGGYGGTLTVMNNREYEVYYLGRYKVDGENNATVVSVKPDPVMNSIISTNEKLNSFDSKDGWFTAWAKSDASSNSSTTVYEEFEGLHVKYKMVEGDSIVLHVSGFDQFRLLAKDNKVDSNPEKCRILQVYIDGVLQTSPSTTDISVRPYDMTSGEHVIAIRAKGTSNNEVYGWSLRLTNEPLAKYISGNDSNQVVNQTQQIAPVRYAIKNFAGSQLRWEDNAVEGIHLEPLNEKGDTMQLVGVANAAVGKYTYIVDALDANGNISTSVSGTFTIQTELRADTTNATVWINDPMQFDFQYFALSSNAIHFTWTDKTPAGLTTAVTSDGIYSIKGTPTADGQYPYTISIDGGNTLSGTIIVDIPSPELIAPNPNVVHIKPGTRITDIVWTIKFASNATVSGLPNGLSGTYNNGQFTISGTAAILANYPQTFTYTITATPQYTGKSSTTATGQIVVIDPNAKSLLYLYKDNYNDAIYNYLGRYDVTARVAEDKMRAAADYNYYNAIVISENVDADNGEVLEIITRLNKPVLNMKSFTYSSSRLNWGNPDNGGVSNLSINVVQPQHPIFREYETNNQFIIPMLTDVDIRGIQPVEVTLKNTLCLAVAPIRDREYSADGDYQTAIHEVPGNLRGSGITARYLLLPISQRSAKYINTATRLLIDACIAYLTDNETGYVMTLPTLQIISFSVAGVSATIDENAKTITCTVPDDVDLTSIAPSITLADNTTHTVPAQGEKVDLSDSHFGLTYTVSDYINSVKYTVICRHATGWEDNTLENVSYSADSQMLNNPDGHVLYIYDVMGRLVSVANSTVSLSDLPRGMYLIQANSASLKIVR